MNRPSKLVTFAAVLLGTAVVLGLCLLVSGVSRMHAVERVVANKNTIAPPDSSKTANLPKGESADTANTIRFAVAPVISPEASYVGYKKLLDYLTARVGLTGELITRDSYAEINELLRTGETDLAMICTCSYIQAHRDYGTKLFLVPVVNGRKDYRSYIVTRKSSSIKSVDDLGQTVLAYADEMSTSGWLYLAVYLQGRGYNPMTHFAKRLRTGSHDRSLSALLEGAADVAAVDSIVFEHADPSIKSSLRILHKSPRFGMPPIVSAKGMDETRQSTLKKVLLSMHLNKEGRTILRELKIDSFVTADESMYSSVAKLLGAWEGGPFSAQ